MDLFRTVETGQIRALWVIHTNPAVTMPEADRVKAAIENCPFTVVSDLTAQTDTARLADVLLPAAGWAEKSGTVTNSDRTISRQRAALEPPGQARADWDILAEVGRRMGWNDAFDYSSPAQIFREHAALSSIAGSLGKDFDISGFAEIDDEDYAELEPTRWPVTVGKTGGRYFGDGQFFYPDGKARFVPVTHRPPKAEPSAHYPFLLNTGRNRDQWHTMTRTGLSPRLSTHLAEPFVDVNPDDASRLNLKPADLVEVQSAIGQGIFRLRITDSVAPGQVFAPIHWTGETAPSARVDVLVPSATDPISGQPESKAAAVSIRPMKAAWYGFAVSSSAAVFTADYWATVKTGQGFRTELAGYQPVADWESTAREWFGLPGASCISVEDQQRGSFRIAFSDGHHVLAALFVSRKPVTLMRDYLATLPEVRLQQILSGRSVSDEEDCGPIVCSCFGVGMKSIIHAIEDGLALDVETLGNALQAGTNCGSCRPELSDLIHKHSEKANRNTRQRERV